MKNTYLFVGAILAVGVAYLTLKGNNAPQTQNIADGAPLVDVIIPTTLSANAQTGQQFFEKACASCHGTNAAGKGGFGPPLIHKIYEPSHHGDEAFQMAPLRGVQAHHWSFGDMPPVEGITRGDIKLIIDYIREVQAANGIQ